MVILLIIGLVIYKLSLMSITFMNIVRIERIADGLVIVEKSVYF